MESYNDAELVGLLILDNLSYLVDKNNAGLYRDDGLVVVRNKRGRSTDKLRKEIVQFFKSIHLQIEIVNGFTIRRLPRCNFPNLKDMLSDLTRNQTTPYCTSTHRLTTHHKFWNNFQFISPNDFPTTLLTKQCSSCQKHVTKKLWNKVATQTLSWNTHNVSHQKKRKIVLEM